MDANKKLKKRLDLYFSLTNKQKRKFSELGGHHHCIELMDMATFQKVTRDRQKIEALMELKRASFRLVA